MNGWEYVWIADCLTITLLKNSEIKFSSYTETGLASPFKTGKTSHSPPNYVHWIMEDTSTMLLPLTPNHWMAFAKVPLDSSHHLTPFAKVKVDNTDTNQLLIICKTN